MNVVKNKENYALLLSGVAVLTSITCSFVKIEPLTFDYVGALVGILSLLVTVLIGWNIYSLIDIRSLRKEIAVERTRVYLESENNLTETFMALSEYYYSSIHGERQPKEERVYKYIYFIISSIMHASRIRDFETCRVIVRTTIETIRPVSIGMSEKNKKNLFDLLSDVNEPRNIQRFSELLALVAAIRTNPC